MSWGNLLPRTVVDVLLRDRATGRDLRVLNTHLDPFSARSRVRSAEHLRRLAADTATAAVVLGDMNSLPGLSGRRRAVRGGDAARRVGGGRRASHARLGHVRRVSAAPRAGRRIDWIAVTRDIAVERVGVNAASVEGLWPSDHLPVQAVVRLTEVPA